MGLVVDLFAGGGGASVGIEAALGRSVDIAINHDAVALAVHKANHPGTRHLEADIWEVQPRAATAGRPVDLLWASPDCRHHSRAKGGKPKSEGVRSLAWAVVRWAADVKPRVICLENVQEFEEWGPLDADGMPDRGRRGLTFRRWSGRLRGLGYRVEHRVLDASHFGAPTRRKRLFLVARNDGRPISWPAATHGPGRLPYRTAAEIIDWSLPCPSIFDRRKPLAEKTLRRVFLGIRRYVFETARPFLVQMSHGEGAGATKRRGRGAHPLEEPLPTVTASNDFGLAIPTLVQTGYGERLGQAPRVPGLDKPLGTLMATGQKHALVAAFMAKHYGDVVGHDLERPMGTITAVDHHGVVQAEMFRAPADRPFRVTEVRAFLTAYYSSGSQTGQSVLEPLRTITAKHRLGLVTVAGEEYQITDIGLRMVQPHELLAAQFGRFAAGYDLSPARTKTAMVRMVGNSVPPEVAFAIVAANMTHNAREAVA